MSDIHHYVHQQDCASREGCACNCVNGCAERVRSLNYYGSHRSTTSLWCGAPEVSPYHYGHRGVCECNPRAWGNEPGVAHERGSAGCIYAETPRKYECCSPPCTTDYTCDVHL